tara:strand:+ start:2222 stop:3565 length:1344 start_codon:yes stop_codon:yes gene_type:complete
MPKLSVKNNSNVTIEIKQALLLFLFFMPLFFQLSGSVFTSDAFNYNAQGKLLLLPLPIAAIFCFIGIAFLLRLEKRHFGMGIIFSIFTLMMLSIVVSSGESGKVELAKFILLVQFTLPTFALVLGGLYLSPRLDCLRYEAVILYVLLLVVPLEVIATVIKGNGLLSPDVYIFSLYQHLQYLPVIFVGLYFLTVNSLYENNKLRYLVLFLAPWMGIYLAASLSILAVILTVLGMLVSSWSLNKNDKRWYGLVLIVILCSSFIFYYPNIQATSTYALKFSPELHTDVKEPRLVKKNNIQEIPYMNRFIHVLPNNLKERFHYWRFYGKGVLESPKIFLFGHQVRPDRNKYPSAHNYYLDLIYHFGVIALFPIIYLIYVTVRNCSRVIRAGTITPDLFMLIVLVGFFVFVDNFLKVSFRQPYPGMVMFFLWGLLLTNLSTTLASRNEIRAS